MIRIYELFGDDCFVCIDEFLNSDVMIYLKCFLLYVRRLSFGLFSLNL